MMGPATKSASRDINAAGKILEVIPPFMGLIRGEMRKLRSELSVQQFRLMVRLYKGSQTNREIAEWFGVNASSASRMVDQLVKNGLIERSAGGVDRREVKLVLSEKGMKRFMACREQVKIELSRRVADLSDAQVKTLFDGLEILWTIL